VGTQSVLDAYDEGGEPLEPVRESKAHGQIDISEFGTFRESKAAPIHRWFQYPAGFSFRGVDYVLALNHIGREHRVYDPFTGTGTTEVVCKGRGISSGGTEAHPFVARIARTKVRWDYDMENLRKTSDEFLRDLRGRVEDYRDVSLEDVPELVRKCYSPNNLRKLILIRELIKERVPEDYRDLFDVAVIGTLRRASAAATGWPYIAPKVQIEEKDGLETFCLQLDECVRDLMSTPREVRGTPSDIVEGDSRHSPFEEESFDFAFTSPPYLNNYDYGDRTRLESYFMGFAATWGEISTKVRDRLIVSATTQIGRTDYETKDIICPELKLAEPRLATLIQGKVDLLSDLRDRKDGRKSYDIMVGQYFNDMTLSIKDTLRVLKPGAKCALILGDSAPYGVHIPTEEYLGQIGCGLGFKRYSVIQMRTRGDKWKANPQRHRVALRESLLVLEK
jgi:hypothetical protein